MNLSANNDPLQLSAGFHLPENGDLSTMHRQSLLQFKEKSRDFEFEQAKTSAGSIVFHHQDVWHGSGPNTSNLPRRVIVSHLINGDVRFAPNSKLPWKASYIYGRYRMIDSDQMQEQFFPIIYPEEKRSKFLKEYCLDSLC
jgi:ectoine hydroxylase-related dioxygenase (phytanoyl-CoA dioxygenase family)